MFVLFTASHGSSGLVTVWIFGRPESGDDAQNSGRRKSDLFRVTLIRIEPGLRIKEGSEPGAKVIPLGLRPQ